MAGPGQTLRQIHLLRRHAHDLREQLNRLPYQLKAQKAKVVKQEGRLREAQESLKKLKVRTLEQEGELRSRHQQIARYQKQLNEATSKKEYDALRHEIDLTRGQCQQIEDQILNTMAETEERTATVPVLEKEVQAAREDLARFEQTAARRQTELGEQVRALEKQIVEVEAQVPEEVRGQYERVVHAMGADALTAARDRTCSACSTEITFQNQNDLEQGRFVVCKSCGRILYLPE